MGSSSSSEASTTQIETNIDNSRTYTDQSQTYIDLSRINASQTSIDESKTDMSQIIRTESADTITTRTDYIGGGVINISQGLDHNIQGSRNVYDIEYGKGGIRNVGTGGSSVNQTITPNVSGISGIETGSTIDYTQSGIQFGDPKIDRTAEFGDPSADVSSEMGGGTQTANPVADSSATAGTGFVGALDVGGGSVGMIFSIAIAIGIIGFILFVLLKLFKKKKQ